MCNLLQEKAVSKALSIVNEKMADIEDAESKALSDVREYYSTCMEALRVRMNGLGWYSQSIVVKICSSNYFCLNR